MSGRGWSANGLKVVADDPQLWTVAEAACHLGPPILTVTQVRQLVRIAGIEPVGQRRTSAHGKPGRYARVYRAKAFIEAYEAISKIKR